MKRPPAQSDTTVPESRRRSDYDLRFLAQAADELSSSLDFEYTLAGAARLAVPYLADLCVIDILDDPGIRPVAVAHIDPHSEQLLRQMRREYPLDLSSAAPVAQVMRSGQPLLFPDVSDQLQGSISVDARHHELLRALAYRSAIVVPLIARGQTVGTIMLVRVDDELRYDANDQSLAEEFARRAADAIDNARLYASEQVARRAAEHAAQQLDMLQRLTSSFSRALTPAEVATVIAGEAADAFGARAAGVAIVTDHGSALRLLAQSAVMADDIGGSLDLPLDTRSPSTEAVRTGQPVWIASRSEWVHRYPGARSPAGEPAAAVAIPLMTDDLVAGVMEFEFDDERTLDDRERSVLLVLAQQCSQALERARLFEGERQARADAERVNERLMRLQEVTASFSRAVTPAEVAEIVIRQSIASVGAAVGSILLLTADGEALELLTAVDYPQDVLDTWTRIPMDMHVQVTEAVRSARSVWISTRDEAYERYPLLATAKTTGAKAFAAVPLIAEARPIGVLGLSFAEERILAEEERTFVELLTQQGAQALERARLFQAEMEARATAEAAVRAREEFLSIAAHELKTPLTSIKGFTQMLQRVVRQPDPDLARLAAYIDTLQSQIARLELLVADLLDISRIAQGRLVLDVQEADLVAIADGVLTQFRGAPEHLAGHTLLLDSVGPVAGVWDAGRIEQVLVNLVSNALKYSPDGGPVVVKLRGDDETVEMSVSDQGIGISEGELARVFQPFVRSAASRSSISGTGLGLAISARIVASHGGTITVTSVVNEGTTFTVRLPRVATSSNDELV